MATQRYISTSFWEDKWIRSLDPSERYLYMYLLTNPLTNIAGIYQITLDRVAFDTGYDERTLLPMFERFHAVGKAFFFAEEWMILPSWPKHQRITKRDNNRKGIDTIIRELPGAVWDYALNAGYQYKYMAEVQRMEQAPSKALEAPLKGLASPSNYLDSDSDINSDTDTDISAGAPDVHILPMRSKAPEPEVEKPVPMQELIDTWNGLGLPRYRFTELQIPNIGAIQQTLSKYSGVETIAAMQNYRKICGSADYTPFPIYPTLPSFLEKGLLTYATDTNPFQRCRKKGAEQKPEVEEQQFQTCENGHSFSGSWCIKCEQAKKAERIAAETQEQEEKTE